MERAKAAATRKKAPAKKVAKKSAKSAKRITMKTGGDPRLHVFETVLREQGIDLVGKKDTKIEEIKVVDTLKRVLLEATTMVENPQ